MEMIPLKANDVLYRRVFPIAMLALFLVFGSLIPRPVLLGSKAGDFFVRLLLSVWFCLLYFRLSRISSYSIYPNKKWSKTDVGKTERYYLWGLILFFSAGIAVVSYFAVGWFLGDQPFLADSIAAINGIVTAYPLFKNYWVIKL